MKSFLKVFGAVILSSSAALAQIPDRREMAPGLFGILHSENFEYVCPITVKERNETYQKKVYFDVNFSSKQKYRVAVGFPRNQKVLDMIAAEGVIHSTTPGACADVCVSIVLKDYDTNKPGGKFDFAKDMATGRVKMTAKDFESGAVVQSTCYANEPY